MHIANCGPQELIFHRLDIEAAIDGVRPIPNFSGSQDDIPVPALSHDWAAHAPKAQKNTHTASSASRPALEPLSRSPVFDRHQNEPNTTQARPKTLKTPPGTKKKNPLMLSSAGFISKRDLSPPALAPQPSKRRNRHEYESDQSTFAPGSIIDRSGPLSSNGPNDWPADYAQSSVRDPSTSPSLSPTAHPVIPMIPTEEQWDSLTDQVVDAVSAYLESNMPTEDTDDLHIQGHPIAWLMGRARTFDESFRAHRPPTHPLLNP